MKKILICMVVLLLAGCAAMQESGWYDHGVHYASWEHMTFSLYGYKNPTMDDVALSIKEQWWGTMVEVEPKAAGTIGKYETLEEIQNLLVR